MALAQPAKDMAALWRQVYRLLRYSSLRLSLLVTLLTALEAFFGLAVLYLIKLLIDVISTQLNGDVGTVQANEIFLYLALTGVGLLLAVVIQALANLARTAQGMMVSDYVDREIHSRAISVDLAFFESPQYFDSLQRARQAGAQRPAQVVSGVLLIFKSVVFLSAVLVMIAGIDWRLLPAIVIAMVAALAVRMRFTRTLFDWQHRRVQLERRAAYLDWLITSDVHSKELRLGDLGGHLRETYSDLRRRIRAEQLRIERRKTLAELVVASIGALVFAGATAFLVLEAIGGQLSIGDLVLFVLLFRRAEGSGRELVTSVSKLYDDQLYLGQLFDFLTVEANIRPPATPKILPSKPQKGIRFEGVDFQYPSNRVPTLEGLNLEVRPGQIVALVGENGSGKTSLIKLMTRLYDPNNGRITLDGTDIREFDPVAYRKLFSVIFQDYSRYADTVRENIRFGDISKAANDTEIEEAAKKAGADSFIEDLHSGYDTPLSRMFDNGQEISIGQWQRLALARAFFPNSKFIIMDEPSSALDPRAEFELFENFRERIGGRGALVISHRLSTVRMADYTYVLDNGKIVEHGTHLDLVERQGGYASIFEKQGRSYRL